MFKSAFLSSFVIGLSIVLTAVILGSAFKNRNAKADTISVTGLGTKNFTSDEISWSGNFNTKAAEAKDAYNHLVGDKEKVKSFFLSKGFTETEFSFGGVSFEKSYRTITIESTENETKTEQIFDGYTATQTINFFSKGNPPLMKKIENVMDQTAELINSGIQFNAYPVQYTYSDLPGLKHNLIENASKDARERVEKIVNTANGKLGKLKTASMGVFKLQEKAQPKKIHPAETMILSAKKKLQELQ